ncbi:MAG: nickel-type superoxide dismutase maturation protease [Pyrinomonadaceae bacterium]|jgi:nickel-type superoxide dismutase maturation protease|nr:nickel-type superoxide dismutase maturation protease [Pyrinomonadaceae bacterium]
MKELPKAGFYEIGLVLLGLLHKYVCEGNSMYPTLKNGDVVMIDKSAKEFEIEDIVLAKHPIEQSTEIIKRIQKINERGHYFLVGDNTHYSNDSRDYGAVTKEYIKGKVVARLG